MVNTNNKNYRIWVRALAILALAGWLVVLFKSLQTLQYSGGTDLRCRMVGARLLFTTASPYHYKWHQPAGHYYLDPNDHPSRPVNGNVATPAALMLLQPVSLLPHQVVRWVWAGFEWLCVWLLLAMGLPGRSGVSKLAWSIVPLLLFFSTDYWQYHQDRGQLYIFYSTLLLGGWYFLQPGHYRPVWAGFCLLLLVTLRPPAIFIPFFIYFFLPPKARRQWVYLALVFTLAFVLPLLTTWQQYLQAMAWYGREYTANLPPPPFTEQMLSYTAGVIEGSTNLTRAIEWKVTCLQPLWYYANKAGVVLQQRQGYMLLGLAIAGASGYLYQRRTNLRSRLSVVFLTGFILMLLAELLSFLPRAPYNITWWVAGVILMYWVLYRGSFMFLKILWIGMIALLLHRGTLGHWAEAFLLVSAILVLALQKRGASSPLVR